jgi:hypothetical protein
MKRRTGILLALALALAVPPTAAAKDLTRAEVCGQSGCAELPRDKSGDGLIQLRGSEGREVSAPPSEAPYYLLVWDFGPPTDDGQTARFATLYTPSANLLAAPGMKPDSVEWFGAAPAVLDKVREATSGLEPYAAPERWPTVISPPSASPAAPARAGDGGEWARLALAAALALLAIAIVFALALRVRLQRPRAA